jgi:hypothetical protein
VVMVTRNEAEHSGDGTADHEGPASVPMEDISLHAFPRNQELRWPREGNKWCEQADIEADDQADVDTQSFLEAEVDRCNGATRQ